MRGRLLAFISGRYVAVRACDSQRRWRQMPRKMETPKPRTSQLTASVARRLRGSVRVGKAQAEQSLNRRTRERVMWPLSNKWQFSEYWDSARAVIILMKSREAEDKSRSSSFLF
ncbi:hypothetical protein KFK09_016897 [Dendrobium nobile]|uniref:Uncharacterized protein n=1 Tax=Dendrobium nobile TaxID=94219 RepID=A0A8T3B1X6_DENNO|nr:hypothetical protein KFK09_016897 [Dendrobium nobile]